METIETVGIINIKTGDAEKNVGSLKQRLKEVQKEMQQMAANGDRASEAYQKLAQEAGQLAKAQREVAKDVSEASTTFSNTVQYTAGALAGVSGAVQTVTSALSMMGVQIGDDNKMMKMLVSAMAMTSGIQAVQNGVEAFKLLYTNIKRSEIAQKALNLAMKSNPIGLVAGAAAALVAVLGTVIMKMNANKDAADDLANSNIKLTNTYRDLNAEMNTFSTTNSREGSKWMDKVIKKYNEMNSAVGGNADNLRNNIKAQTQAAIVAKNTTEQNLLIAVDAYRQLKQADLDYNLAIRTHDEEAIKSAKKVMEEREAALNSIYVSQQKKETTTTKATPVSKEYTEYERRMNQLKLWREQNVVDERLYTELVLNEEMKRLKAMGKGTKEYDEQLINIQALRNKLKELGDGKLNIETEPAVVEVEKLTVAVNDLYDALNNLGELSFGEKIELTIGRAAEWWGQYGSTVSSVTSQVSSCLNQLASDEDRSFEEQKKLKIAAAVISTLQGAVDAFMSAQSLGQPWGLIVGSANAALVTATGMAQINQIKKQTKDSASVGTSPSATSTLSRNYTNTRLTDGSGAEVDLGEVAEKINNKKVYVTVADINEAQSQVRVTKGRNTF